MSPDYHNYHIISSINESLTQFEFCSDKLIELLEQIKTNIVPDSARPKTNNGLFPSLMDPFSFYIQIFRYNDRTRRSILLELKSRLNLSGDIPSAYPGFPTANAWWLFADADSQEESVPALWQLFKSARRLSKNQGDSEKNSFYKDYDRALEIKGVADSNLPQCLFYICPDFFPPLDRNLKEYGPLRTLIPDIEWSSSSGARYLDALDRIQEALLSNKLAEDDIPHLSERAYAAARQDGNNVSSAPRYMFLNLSPREWDPRQSPTDEEMIFHTKRQNGKSLKKIDCFKHINTGDYFIAYMATPIKAACSVLQATKPYDGSALYFRRLANFNNPVPFNTLKDDSQVSTMGNLGRRGITLDEISEQQFFHIQNELEGGLAPESSVIDRPMRQNNASVALNTVLFGAPGTGKTYQTKRRAVGIIGSDVPDDWDEISDRYKALEDEGRIGFVSFHQSFSYEDFVEGIRPVLTDGERTSPDDSHSLAYAVEDGVFKSFCEKAANHPSDAYVFIIDELNRGNVAAIFGELITLLEEDKRLGGEDERTVLLPYSKQRWGIPGNVHIIATMNTADRSLTKLDAAFRRRFSFEEVGPDYDALRNHLGNEGIVDGVDVPWMLQAMNARIEALLDRDHVLGHSLFWKVASLGDIRQAFAGKIIPLLQDYFFEDYDLIRAVLNDRDGKFVHKIGDDESESLGIDLGILDNMADTVGARFEVIDRTDGNAWSASDFRRIYESFGPYRSRQPEAAADESNQASDEDADA